MAQANLYSPEDIQRRASEFEEANHRDHLRFAVLAIGLAAAVILGLLLALAD